MSGQNYQETSSDKDGTFRSTSDSAYSQLSENSISVKHPTDFKSSECSDGSQPGSLITLPEFPARGAVQDNQPAPNSYANALQTQEQKWPRESELSHEELKQMAIQKNGEVVRLKTELTELEAENEDMQKTIVVLQSDLNTKEDQVVVLNSRLHKSKDKIDVLENKLSIAARELRWYKDKVGELSEELSEAKQYGPYGNASDTLSPQLHQWHGQPDSPHR